MKIFKRQFKNTTRWGIDFTLRGKRKRIIVADTKKEAQAFAEEVIQNKNKIKIGLPVSENGRAIPDTIGKAIDIYLTEKISILRSSAPPASILKDFKTRYGKLKIDEIGRVELEQYRDRLYKENYAVGAIKRKLTTIATFFAWGTKQRPKWFDENPATNLVDASYRGITKNVGWERMMLNHPQVRAIVDYFKETDPERSDFILWSFLTMQRPSEAKTIKFSDFDTDEWKLRIPSHKSGGRPKVLVVDGELKDIYERQFSRRNGNPLMWRKSLFDGHSYKFKKACKDLGIPLKFGNGLYVLKSSGISFHVNILGTPIADVSQISGVSIKTIMAHYLRTSEARTRQALKNASYHFWHEPGTDEPTTQPQTVTHQEFPA